MSTLDDLTQALAALPALDNVVILENRADGARVWNDAAWSFYQQAVTATPALLRLARAAVEQKAAHEAAAAVSQMKGRDVWAAALGAAGYDTSPGDAPLEAFMAYMDKIGGRVAAADAEYASALAALDDPPSEV